ncbi:MAG TPA: RpiB/LacA/LacB family sugar-phosphate isomerase [Gaiella sp.]|jgi:ribose 5-phosphate isomerase B|nr:RpiB/LacA/LacB family sugar-phosphate isomerase [Gaiella sp.]
MRVALGFDHRGVRLRDVVFAAVAEAGHEAVDLGVDTDAVRVDYPDTARAVGEEILRGGAERGVLVCGSGAGVSIAASKLRGIRAAMCHDAYSAHQAVEHDDMNVLCLGSEIVGPSLAAELVQRFLAATFVGEGRYLARLRKVEELERLVDG